MTTCCNNRVDVTAAPAPFLCAGRRSTSRRSWNFWPGDWIDRTSMANPNALARPHGPLTSKRQRALQQRSYAKIAATHCNTRNAHGPGAQTRTTAAVKRCENISDTQQCTQRTCNATTQMKMVRGVWPGISVDDLRALQHIGLHSLVCRR